MSAGGRLEELFRQFEKQKQIRLSPAVRDYKTAGHWLTELGASRFDGVVAKQLDCTYLLRRAQRHAEDQAFRRLHRCVSQQELDLLQFTTAAVA